MLLRNLTRSVVAAVILPVGSGIAIAQTSGLGTTRGQPETGEILGTERGQIGAYPPGSPAAPQNPDIGAYPPGSRVGPSGDVDVGPNAPSDPLEVPPLNEDRQGSLADGPATVV